MNSDQLPLQIGDIVRADFRTSFLADAANTRLQKKFSFPFRYQPARIALSLSLRDPTVPSLLDDNSGRPIKGDFLFGSDESELSTWVALIVHHSGDAGLSRREFQNLVACHWGRGIAILNDVAATLPDQPERLFAALIQQFGVAMGASLGQVGVGRA